MEAGDRFFDRPILNSPYDYPSHHWELDESGQPTNRILDRRRQVSFITPIPKPKKGKGAQQALVFDEEAQRVAWQTINAVRRPSSRRFTRGFLVVIPGITIKDRLRVLQPNDPDSYYKNRELVPGDMLGDLDRAKIVVSPKGTPASAPTSRTTASDWRCRTVSAAKRAPTSPTSSCWWTTGEARTTPCT